MQRMSRFLGLCFLAVAILSSASPAVACSQPPGYGFIIHSMVEDHTRGPFIFRSPQVGQSLYGNWLGNGYGGAGDIFSFQGITDGKGLLSELGKATPALWRITPNNGRCSSADPTATPPFYKDMDFLPNSTPQDVTCFINPSSGFSVSPSGMNSNTTQATVTGNMYGRRPVTWAAYDRKGNYFDGGDIGNVTSNSCVCYMSFGGDQPSTSGLTAYMLDSAGEGVGTFRFNYTQ